MRCATYHALCCCVTHMYKLIRSWGLSMKQYTCPFCEKAILKVSEQPPNVFLYCEECEMDPEDSMSCGFGICGTCNEFMYCQDGSECLICKKMFCEQCEFSDQQSHHIDDDDEEYPEAVCHHCCISPDAKKKYGQAMAEFRAEIKAQRQARLKRK